MSIYDGSGSTQYPGNQSRVRRAFSPLCSRGSCSSVELKCGTENYSSTTSCSLLNLPIPCALTATQVRLYKEGHGWLCLEESWKASLRRWHVSSLLNAAAAAKSLQSCPTLCDPRDGSPSGSPVPGTLQARTLERVAISFSNAWKWKVKVK